MLSDVWLRIATTFLIGFFFWKPFLDSMLSFVFRAAGGWGAHTVAESRWICFCRVCEMAILEVHIAMRSIWFGSSSLQKLAHFSSSAYFYLEMDLFKR